MGTTSTRKVSGAQTGGAFALLEAVVPPGGGPPHIHDAEDETFIILQGEIALTTPAGTSTAAVGTVVPVPKGTLHSYATVGAEPVRMLFLYVPAGRGGTVAITLAADASRDVPVYLLTVRDFGQGIPAESTCPNSASRFSLRAAAWAAPVSGCRSCATW